MSVLVYDTETTGKADFKAPVEDPVQPRLVQLAAILLGDDLQPVELFSLVIKPEGFTISNEVAEIHGITQEKALRYGVSEKAALHLFNGLCRKAKVIVSHNLQFDGIVIGRALAAQGMSGEPPPKKCCTMVAMTDIIKMPGKYGNKYKWPSLAEAYYYCDGKEIIGAHDALADATACASIYRWLITNNHIT